MQKLHLLVIILILLTTSFVFSQTLMDYVDEVRGDTLVIKDYWDMTEQNSLYQALTLDVTDVPEGRVYMLKTAGYYPLVNNPATQRPTVIVGEDNTILVNNDDAGSIPPLICGAAWDGGSNNGSMTLAHDFTIKNCNIVPGTANQGLGWSFFGASNDVNITFENCLFERTRWVFTNTNGSGISWHMLNCYFVNMTGQPCRRNGGVLDSFAPQGTLLVENNTHIMAQGLMYKVRANPYDRIIMNHNTFVNMSNYIFMDLGSQSAMSVTNNIFVNCQVQPYSIANLDVGEEDIDKLPTGIINAYPDTAVHVDRKIYVDNNVIYWDPKLDDVVSTVNTNQVNNRSDWVSQMITMNTRTQSMFDDAATYPYLQEGSWIEELPNFADPQNLFTDALDNLKAFSIGTIDTTSADVLPDWRISSTGDENFLYCDWPIPVDLSFDNTSLLTAARGFPVGDVNWFPAQKAAWEAQRDVEYAAIQGALNSGGAGGAVNNNFGFESSPVGVDTTFALDGWALAAGADVDPAPVFEIVDQGAQEGSKALKITIGAIGANAWNIEVTGDNIPVEPGATYTYSVWLKSEATGGTADVTVGNYAYNEYGSIRPADLTDAWQKFTFEFTITDQETRIRAPLHFSKAVNVGKAVYIDNLTITKKATSIKDAYTTPGDFRLNQNYPNPFNPTTTIKYELAVRGMVTVKVFNSLGQEITTLVNQEQAQGKHEVVFNGNNLASGVYFVTLTSKNFTDTKKMVLLK